MIDKRVSSVDEAIYGLFDGATLMVSGEIDMLRYNATEAQAARPNISA